MFSTKFLNIMKKHFLKSSTLFLGLSLTGLGVVYTSCSEDKEVYSAAEVAESQVSFGLSLPDITKAEALDEESGTTGTCYDPEEFKDIITANPNDYYAEITILTDGNATTTQKKLRVVDGIITSDPISLKAVNGLHSLVSLHIIEDATGDILYSTVNTGSKFEAFVPAQHVTPYSIQWGENEDETFETMKKKVCTMTALCAVNDYAEDFGYAQWGTELIKATCINYSINVCGDPCNLFGNGHKIGTTEVTISKKIKESGEYIELWSGESKDGSIGEMCFSDAMSYKDEDEIFSINIDVIGYGTISTEVTGAEIFNYGYKESGYWEYPLGTETGYLHFDLCDIDWTKDAIVPHINEDAANPWTFKVSEVEECEKDCDEKCGDAFLANFGINKNEGCDWYASSCSCNWPFISSTSPINGTYTFERNKTNYLISPALYLSEKTTYVLEYKLYTSKNASDLSIQPEIISLNGETINPMSFTEVETKHGGNNQSKEYTLKTFQYTFCMPAECNKIKIKFCAGIIKLGNCDKVTYSDGVKLNQIKIVSLKAK